MSSTPENLCGDIVRAQVIFQPARFYYYALLFLCPSEPEFLFGGTSLRLDGDWHPRHHVYLQLYGMLRFDFLSTKLCLEQKLDNCLPCGQSLLMVDAPALSTHSGITN